MDSLRIVDMEFFQRYQKAFYKHAETCSHCATLIGQRQVDHFCAEGERIIDQCVMLVRFAEILGARFK